MAEKILVHALGATMGGALRHLTSFLPELSLADPHREYDFLVRATLPSIRCGTNIRLIRLPDALAEDAMKRFWFDNIKLPARLRASDIAALVSLTNFGPIRSSVPHVFFQRNSIYYCADYLAQVPLNLKVNAFLRRRLALSSMLHAELIVTPSEAMANMIRETCPETRSRTFVTLYHGFDYSTFSEPLSAKHVELVGKIKGAKLIYPAHPAYHKGFDILFEAMGILKRNGVDVTLLTTIQNADWPTLVDKYDRQIDKLAIRKQVVYLGRVPQSQMGALYNACDLMVYPSLCESFGFSMIEALGHQLPIVAADTAVNREMCANAALYYPRLDPSACANAIQSALEPNSKELLVRNGKLHLQSYDWSWARYAREFVSIIDNLDIRAKRGQ